MAKVLTTRELNRALLARQLLLERETRPALDVIDHLVGLQAQVPRDPYIALWSRLSGFDPAEVEGLLIEKKIARSPLMRGTIHLATADDTLELRALVQTVLERGQKAAFGRRLPEMDLAELARTGGEALSTQPMTFAQLREHFADEWEGLDYQALGYSVSYLVPLVQVPPRGLWSRSGQATWFTTEAWLGRPLPKEPSLERMLIRYLAAFGPASAADAQTWCGLTKLGAVFERLRPQLVTFEDENGRELFDLPDAPRPPGQTLAPVRFLPQYDNVFLSHADRTRIVSDRNRVLASQPNGYQSSILVDGFGAALWRIVVRGKTEATIEITPLERWTQRTASAVEDEGGRLLVFLAPNARSREVKVGRAVEA